VCKKCSLVQECLFVYSLPWEKVISVLDLENSTRVHCHMPPINGPSISGVIIMEDECLIDPKENTIVRISGPPPHRCVFGTMPRFRDTSAD